MPLKISSDTITEALELAHINNYSGNFEALGGGEVNDTYKIHLQDGPIILRITKDEGQQTLANEARSLGLLDSEHIPKLLFFDKTKLVNNRFWILETYIPGKTVTHLSSAQFYCLGRLLADIHKTPAPNDNVDLKEQFFNVCSAFGDEHKLMNHPDPQIKTLVINAIQEFSLRQASFDHIKPALTHVDVTLSNILVDEDNVGLIDWEFSKFSDPMIDFSTFYYEDMQLNKGKWRIQIEPSEKADLFAGYESGGGNIDEDRIRFWIRFDKLGAVIFLYWRIYESPRYTTRAETDQYQEDLRNLMASLTVAK